MYSNCMKYPFIIMLTGLLSLQSCTNSTLIKTNKETISQTPSNSSIEMNHWQEYSNSHGDFHICFPQKAVESIIKANLSTQGYAFFCRGNKYSTLSKKYGLFSLEVFDLTKSTYSTSGRCRLEIPNNTEYHLSAGIQIIQKKYHSAEFFTEEIDQLNGLIGFHYEDNGEEFSGYIQAVNGKLYVLRHGFSSENMSRSEGLKLSEKFWNSFSITQNS
ncbi:MAG: hypothetical protein ACI8RA_001967 [Chlamydiales bacterium]|jgi:hypothetical protein